MNTEGFITLDRKILEWEWYTDPNTSRLFIHMLLKANWKDKQWQGMTIKRGSFISSIGKLASETGMTERSVRTALSHLLKTGEIDKQVTSKFSLYTIINYNLYQCDVTSKRQASDKQVTTTNKYKKDNKEKIIRKTAFNNFKERDNDEIIRLLERSM